MSTRRRRSLVCDETYVRAAGQWRYVYRGIDQFGQVIDVFVTPRRDAKAARRFFQRAIGTTKVLPVEVVTDRAATYRIVLEELLPVPWHRTEQYANNRVEADHGRLKSRLGPMRGRKQDRSARVIVGGLPLSRTFEGAITSWPLRSWGAGGWPSRSTSWPWRSEPRWRSRLHLPWPGSMQQRLPLSGSQALPILAALRRQLAVGGLVGIVLGGCGHPVLEGPRQRLAPRAALGERRGPVDLAGLVVIHQLLVPTQLRHCRVGVAGHALGGGQQRAAVLAEDRRGAGRCRRAG
jgi:hypothetical protein